MYKANLSFGELYPLFRYMNELVKCRCLPDLLSLNLFPNAKELTESAAAYNAVRKQHIFELSDRGVCLLSVGDGCTPRTAAMFAFRSAWTCFSIDPRLRQKSIPWPIDRLYTIAARVEDITPRLVAGWDKLVIVAVHSHAPLEECMKWKAKQRLVVSIPCCVPQTRERKPDLTYYDMGIWSPENKVLVWKDEE
jgi:hypothetical protein